MTIAGGLSSFERPEGSTDTEALREGALGGFAFDLLRRPPLRAAVVLAVLNAGERVAGITGDSEIDGAFMRGVGVFCSDALRDIGFGLAAGLFELLDCC